MRLKNKNESVAGGLYYLYEDDKGNNFRVNGYHVSWNSFITKILDDMSNNNVQAPPRDQLEALVEDQICMRQAPDKCWYENKVGDNISKAIHTFLGGVDKVAKVLGVNTKLERAARGCGGCGNRRRKLNKL